MSVWKVARELRNRKTIESPLKVDNFSFTSDSDKATIFAELLQSQCPLNPSSVIFFDFHNYIFQTVHQFSPTNNNFHSASPNEIITIIHFLNNRNSPGRYGIWNNVLKILPQKYNTAICNIINTIMKLGYFPSVWKEATVICLPKKSKPLSCPSSHRTISLLFSKSKIAKAIILYFIADNLNQRRKTAMLL